MAKVRGPKGQAPPICLSLLKNVVETLFAKQQMREKDLLTSEDVEYILMLLTEKSQMLLPVLEMPKHQSWMAF